MPQQKPVDLERFFLALAEQTLLRLLNLMGEDEVLILRFEILHRWKEPSASVVHLKVAMLLSSSPPTTVASHITQYRFFLPEPPFSWTKESRTSLVLNSLSAATGNKLWK
jgi:hypothetical protein